MLAIIPARMGSKGIKGKNLKNFCGNPLISYTIKEAQKSSRITDILLSTESNEIANYSATLGISINYRRPKKLATDKAGMFDVLVDAINWYSKVKNLPKEIILLQPTSPLRNSYDIDKSIEIFKHSGSAKSLVSVSPMVEHPYECISIDKEACQQRWSFLKKPKGNVLRRQDYLDEFFFINGAIYIATVEFLLTNKTFLVEGQTIFYEMPKSRSVDIDDMYGWLVGEALYENKLIL